MRGAAFLLVALVGAGGCSRKQQPSPDYERAAVLYQQLYARELDDAYGDPQMDEVVAGLRKVEPRSADARAARDLLATIERGRGDFAKSQERRRNMEAVSAADLKKTSNIDPQAILAAREGPDAGQTLDPTGAGASIADLNRENGGCLVADQPFREEGTGRSGLLYRLAPSSSCKEKLPGFIGQAAMVVDGKIYRRIPDPTGGTNAPADGGVGGAPDGGGRPGTKASAAPPLPDGAQLVRTDPDGTKHYVVPTPAYVPGMPTGDPATAVAKGETSPDAPQDVTPRPPPPGAPGATTY